MSATAMSNANFITQVTTLADCVGQTPLVKLQRLPEQEHIENGATLLAKLEGNNPAGSVKDRPAFNMIYQAEQRGDIKPGDTLIVATSGTTITPTKDGDSASVDPSLDLLRCFGPTPSPSNNSIYLPQGLGWF